MALRLAIISAIFVTLSSFSYVEGAVVNAASCSTTDVALAISAASDGDTVQIPAGSCIWRTTVSISKGITLAGAGPDVTVIQDGFDRTSWDGPILAWTTSLGQRVRLTNMTLSQIYQAVAPCNGYTCNGSFRFSGTTQALRIDHMKFDHVNMPFQIFGFIYGVIDHNSWTFAYSVANAMRIGHGSWNNTGDYGDASWADDSHYGTNRAIFVEDNTFNGTDRIYQGNGPAVNDINYGGRMVFRHNTCIDTFVQGHAFEGRIRGARLIEVYQNTFQATATQAAFTAVYWRTGSALVWGNTSTGYVHFINLINDRSVRRDLGALWGTCGTWNGTRSNWDQNSDGTTGYACLDQPGRGKGDLLSGPSPTPAWPHQAVEPIYVWNNSWTAPPNYGTASLVSVGGGPIAANRDYFACSDASCAPAGYSPFTYPHPLTAGSGVGTPPLEPSNLVVR